MIRKILYVVLGLFAVLALFLATGCVNLVLPKVDESGNGASPTPAMEKIVAATPRIESPAGLNAMRETMLSDFEAEIYGSWPRNASLDLRTVTVVEEGAFNGKGIIEHYLFDVHYGGDAPSSALGITLTRPLDTDGPMPLFLLQSFCGSPTVYGRDDLPQGPGQTPSPCDGGSWMMPAITYVFGRYIGEKPIEAFLDRGIAFASYYPGDVVPDRSETGVEALNTRFDDYEHRPGAIGVWAWTFSALRQHFDSDDRFDPDATIVYGHSRHGKAAFVAGAFDPEIDLIIAHQSGRGGASLSRSDVGESIGEITTSYPHWFTPAYESFADRADALTYDQHVLMALIAPRPLFLGNARRDRWSDPASSWQAARSASAVWEASGATGLVDKDMADFHPGAGIVYFLRNGRHGQTTADFDAFFAFLDAHLGTSPED